MSAQREVEDALARLREAGAALRARPVAAVHDALADVLDAWRAPGSPWQAELVARLPATTGFSAETVRRGLALGLAPYSGAALRALVQGELGGPERFDAGAGARADGFATTATVLAGAIPLPAVVAIVAPLAVRAPVLVYPAAHDPVTAPLLARALAEREPALGACVEIADFRRDDEAALAALGAADCVVATGSDEAVAAIGARVAAPRRFVGHGHRFSLALLGPGATRGEALAAAARGLALDVAFWDQLGCLSPVSAHVVDADPRAAERVADALAEALAALEKEMPRGRVEPAAAAAIARERAEAEMRAAAGAAVSLRTGAGTSWTVVREADARPRPAPLHRFVRVHPAAELEHAIDALRPHGTRLAGVALAGFGAVERELAGALAALGASRTCAPGALQAPPLAWPRGGVGVLSSLARFASLEPDR